MVAHGGSFTQQRGNTSMMSRIPHCHSDRQAHIAFTNDIQTPSEGNRSISKSHSSPTLPSISPNKKCDTSSTSLPRDAQSILWQGLPTIEPNPSKMQDVILNQKNNRYDASCKSRPHTSESHKSRIRATSDSSVMTRPKGITKLFTVTKDDPSMHSGRKIRYLCPEPECQKDFSTSGHARRHSRIHTDMTRFACPHEGCLATFSRRDNCTQHQRSSHKSVLLMKK